jgi:dolichyl-diphosphooligosaccharide--protein glycosyltransferase
MTENREQLSSDSLLAYAERWYHVAGIAALLVYMFWVRIQAFDKFTINGQVFFSGNDAYYHFRQVRYTVEHFPAVMPFDPWTYFPFGTSVGQFGTLYDQLVALAALVVGLGNPSEQTIALTLMLAPAVLATLVGIPVYLIGRRLGGRPAGLFGLLVLALVPGLFLARGTVGAADHNVVEPLFQALAVLVTMVAVSVAHREKPVWEQVVDRDVAGLRAPVGWSALAGVAIAAYVWVWPPAVLLIGILGVFYLVRLAADYYAGQSPEHVAFVGAVSMLVATVLTLLPLRTVGFETTQFSLLQPLAAAAVGAGAVFLAALARLWDDRDLDRTLYPVTVAGIVVVGTGLVAVLLPDLFSLVRVNLVRFVGFGSGEQTRTIVEAQPLLARSTFFDAVYQQYGLAFFTAGAGALLMLAQAVRYGRRNPEYTLLLVWTAFVTSAAFTQVRFNTYLAVAVAVMNAYLLAWLLGLEFFGTITDVTDVTASHVFAIAAVLLVVVAPLTIATAGGSVAVGAKAERVGANAQPSAAIYWDGTLDWMQENTPAEGTYGGADNGDVLDNLGTYPRQSDFDYPAGAYGVMSWWDYGHWITVLGDRIPNANPFQEGASTAANYLLAPNESAANRVLADLDEDDAETRYVMVDWQMAEPFSKFGAPTVFYDRNGTSVSQSEFITPIRAPQQDGSLPAAFYHRSQRYYESQMVRLYQFHGSAVGGTSTTTVVDWDRARVQTGGGTAIVRVLPEEGSPIRTFDNRSAAEAYVANDSTSAIGGVGSNPGERVDALEHYRLVKYSDVSATGSSSYRSVYQRLLAYSGLGLEGLLQTNPAWVKLFERVPGATVRGEGPANETVVAAARMYVPASNSTFTYRQYAETGPDGEFTMTLPYATEGYDDWGPAEGYTNVSVRARGNYSIYTDDIGFRQANNSTWYGPTAIGRTDVSEAHVIGENTTPIRVTLDRTGPDNRTGTDNESTSSLAPLDVGSTGAPATTGVDERTATTPSARIAG